jgi:hypothetical protein
MVFSLRKTDSPDILFHQTRIRTAGFFVRAPPAISPNIEEEHYDKRRRTKRLQ